METTRYELADSFIKYITGVYVLQQDFIDDMRGGLQAILEKYNVTLVGSNTEESNATHEAVNEPQTAAKKTRKKNTKKEAAVIEEQTINDVVEEQLEGVEEAEGKDLPHQVVPEARLRAVVLPHVQLDGHPVEEKIHHLVWRVVWCGGRVMLAR